MNNVRYPAVPEPMTEAAFDAILLFAHDIDASSVMIRSGEPLSLRHDVWAPIALDPRPMTDSDVIAVSRYVYGEHAHGMLLQGHTLNPNHEVRPAVGRTVRCRAEIARFDGRFALVANL